MDTREENNELYRETSHELPGRDIYPRLARSRPMHAQTCNGHKPMLVVDLHTPCGPFAWLAFVPCSTWTYIGVLFKVQATR